MLTSNLRKFVGESVFVCWHDSYDDWHWQRLVGFEGDEVWFRGLDAPNGDKHDGKMWSCKAREIKSCKLLPVGKTGGV